jgi:hypothetical protein
MWSAYIMSIVQSGVENSVEIWSKKMHLTADKWTAWHCLDRSCSQSQTIVAIPFYNDFYTEQLQSNYLCFRVEAYLDLILTSQCKSYFQPLSMMSGRLDLERCPIYIPCILSSRLTTNVHPIDLLTSTLDRFTPYSLFSVRFYKIWKTSTRDRHDRSVAIQWCHLSPFAQSILEDALFGNQWVVLNKLNRCMLLLVLDRSQTIFTCYMAEYTR